MLKAFFPGNNEIKIIFFFLPRTMKECFFNRDFCLMDFEKTA
jgi:hypothetical protein